MSLSAEVQLLAWYKSTSKSGPRVVLLLQSDDDIDFFERLTLAKGKTAGQILDVDFKLSQQDDQSDGSFIDLLGVVPNLTGGKSAADFVRDGRESSGAGPTGLRCREAVGLMKEKDFAVFVAGTPFIDTPKKYVQHHCGIESRREFDEGPDADEKYTKFCGIKKKYREWQRRMG